ncbi:MAG: hypothetical protein PVJ27_09420 [Candidatus Brocadiaceae bacterium]|jgi:hypothetical protein
MPRSLPSKPSLEYVRKEAKRLLAAHQRGDASACEVLRCLRRFAGVPDAEILAANVSLQKVQHALAQDYGFRSWAKLREFCSDVRSIPYSVCPGRCGPRYAEELQVAVTEVLGTSAAVRTGEQYLVRGEYELASDSDIARVMLSGLGRNRGKPCPLPAGRGQFELTTELLEAEPDRERYLDILIGTKSGDVVGTRLRIALEPQIGSSDGEAERT